MLTIDANRCPTCPKKETCADRRVLLRTLSPVVNAANLDEEAEHADITISLNCHRTA